MDHTPSSALRISPMIAGLVETWHDGPDTPPLVACAPLGYVYTERSRPRPGDKVDTIATNRGVCLIYRLYSRLVNTAQYQTFEHIAVFLHGSGLKSLFVVIYRPGSAAAPSSFFDEFADLLDHVTSYSSVVIMGDVNLHLESPTDAGAVRFLSLLAMNNLVQVVQSPTHTAGHLLDVVVVVVRSDTMVTSVNVPSPVLSDHSMNNVALGLRCCNLELFTRVARGGRLATMTLSAIFSNRTSYAVRRMMSLN